MKTYPALDIACTEPDRLLADLDDYGPTAVEEIAGGVRVFFPTQAVRDLARRAILDHHRSQAVDVSDEDWAQRSQQNLTAVTVGGLTIAPPWLSSSASPAIVINPSMGFGTGHHATTRLCLAGLQRIDLSGAAVLDVGTGSGILAIAARILGAYHVMGVDNDADALTSAEENLALNPAAAGVVFRQADLTQTTALAHVPQADVVMANLTGALLVRAATVLMARVASGGRLLVSGLLADERSDVAAAFAPWPVAWEQSEDGWMALMFRRPDKV